MEPKNIFESDRGLNRITLIRKNRSHVVNGPSQMLQESAGRLQENRHLKLKLDLISFFSY